MLEAYQIQLVKKGLEDGFRLMAGDQVTWVPKVSLPGTVTGTEAGPFSFVTGESDGFSIQVGSGLPQSVTLVGSDQTAEEVIAQINDATSDLVATVVSDKVCITANGMYDDIEILTVDDDAYTALGFEVGVNAASPGMPILTGLMCDRWTEDGLVIDDAGEKDQNKRELYFLKDDLAALGVTITVEGYFLKDGERWDFSPGEPICEHLVPICGIHNMVGMKIRKAVELNNASPGGAWGYDLED